MAAAIIGFDAKFGALMPPINFSDINDFFFFSHKKGNDDYQTGRLDGATVSRDSVRVMPGEGATACDGKW